MHARGADVGEALVARLTLDAEVAAEAEFAERREEGGPVDLAGADRDTAWARDDATDHQLTRALRGNLQAVVKGRSSKNILTTDVYSLNGSGAAYQAISSACNVKL